MLVQIQDGCHVGGQITLKKFQKTLNVTKSYTYLGHIITDNLCDEADFKATRGSEICFCHFLTYRAATGE